jgi:hypothetical protein
MAEIEAQDIHVWRRRFLSRLESIGREAPPNRQIATVGPVALPLPKRVAKFSAHTLTHSHAMTVVPAGSGKVAKIAAKTAGTIY